MSMSFEQVCNLKPDTIFWDHHLSFMVVTNPDVYEENGHTKVYFFAQPINENGWADSMDAPVEYLFTKELMHYSPSIYFEKEYESPEKLRNLLRNLSCK